MITKSIISRNINGQIEITGFDDRDNLDDIIQKHVISRGNTLMEIIEGIIEKPESREHRDCWDFNNGKVEVDQAKVQAKEDAISQKESQKQLILSKIGITEEELGNIIKR